MIIGAGFDTFAWRRPDLAGALTIFEHDSVATALARVSFDPVLPTFFAWHGVTYYLTREAISATFRAARRVASPGSDLVFDYWDTAHYTPESRAPVFDSVVKLVDSWGEPFLTSFTPDELREELTGVGFQVVEDMGKREFEQRYFDGRTDALVAHTVHRCCGARSV